MSVLEETKYLMKKYKIKANKSLGQNFLIDDTVIEDIVGGASIGKDDLVIEIGPGLGSMTALLVEKAKKVICVELDKKMIKILNDRFIADDNIELINEDVLKLDLNKLIKQEKEQNEIKDVKIVANLPYYITTPIIMKLLEERLEIESITVMVQKEVADRLVAKPGGKNSGAITYAISYFADAEKVLEVPNTSFMPAPEVNSSVIKLNILREPSVKVESEKMLFNVIKLAFAQKRKTLLNALTNGKLANKEEVEKMLIDLNLDLKIRGEKLSLQDFARIADYMEEKR